MGWTFIGNTIVNRRGGGSWSTYWTHQSEVLFFGLYSEISDGKMPNKVTGATDYLTVAGVAGSETYQCPNTAPYIAADTDYIWFKTDESQRTVTTAELIGYDLQRTPVKYEDDAPNEIVAIMILKVGETIAGTKRDKLFTDMWLPIMWDDSLSAYGHVKDNRGATQQLWTPETVVPSILTDTDKTKLWIDYLDLTTITKDGANLVAAWNDKNGNGNDLVQTTDARKPLYQTTGILFDGTSDQMQKAFTLAQPFTMILVFKQITWTQLDRVLMGILPSNGGITQYENTPEINLYFGAGGLKSSQLALGAFGIVTAKVNGASSSLQVNDNAEIAGNVGTNALGGVHLGSYNTDNTAQSSNIEVKGVIVINEIVDAPTLASIKSYLTTLYSL